jgi:hypothetical protein
MCGFFFKDVGSLQSIEEVDSEKKEDIEVFIKKNLPERSNEYRLKKKLKRLL